MKQFMILFVLMLLLLASCRSVQYVPVESSSKEEQIVEKIDSVYVCDSSSMVVMAKGDTIYRTLEKWRIEYRERIRRDTLVKVDSIPVPYPVEVIKERSIPPWQQVLMLIGAASIAASLVFLILKFKSWK